MKTTLYVLLLLTTCLTLTACDPGQRPQSISSHEPNYATTATLWINKENYTHNEPVHIKFTTKNTSDKQLVLEGNPVMDIQIIILTQKRYPRWSDDHLEEAKALNHLELAPGEAHTIEWIWLTPEVSDKIYGVSGLWKRSDGLQGDVQLNIKINWYPR